MLVAIDGSESSLHALSESFKLAESEKSWITTVCVAPVYDGDLDMLAIGNVSDDMKNYCAEASRKAVELAERSNMQIKFIPESGVLHEQIIDVANDYNCELIVMGRRGQSRLKCALIGSVSARVIGYSNIDVLIIPLGSTVGWKNILVATDGSRYSDQAIERAIDFASAYGGKVSVVSVVDVPYEASADAERAIEELNKKADALVQDAVSKADAENISVEGFVRNGHSHEEILELSEELSADVVFLGSHGRTGLRRLLLGGVAEKVIGLSKSPVLIAK
jgi:nucleotide-binding universal stress UspA family protein